MNENPMGIHRTSMKIKKNQQESMENLENQQQAIETNAKQSNSIRTAMKINQNPWENK